MNELSYESLPEKDTLLREKETFSSINPEAEFAYQEIVFEPIDEEVVLEIKTTEQLQLYAIRKVIDSEGPDFDDLKEPNEQDYEQEILNNPDQELADDLAFDFFDKLSQQLETTTGPSAPYLITKNSEGEYGAIDEQTGQWRSSRSLFENGNNKDRNYDAWITNLESGGIDITTTYDEEKNRTWITVNQLAGDSIVSVMVEIAGEVRPEDIQSLFRDNELEIDDHQDLESATGDIDFTDATVTEIDNGPETDFDDPVITTIEYTEPENIIIVEAQKKESQEFTANSINVDPPLTEQTQLQNIRNIIEAIYEPPVPAKFEEFIKPKPVVENKTTINNTPIEPSNNISFNQQKEFRDDIQDLDIIPVRAIIDHIENENTVTDIITKSKPKKSIAPQMIIPNPTPQSLIIKLENEENKQQEIKIQPVEIVEKPEPLEPKTQIIPEPQSISDTKTVTQQQTEIENQSFTTKTEQINIKTSTKQTETVLRQDQSRGTNVVGITTEVLGQVKKVKQDQAEKEKTIIKMQRVNQINIQEIAEARYELNNQTEAKKEQQTNYEIITKINTQKTESKTNSLITERPTATQYVARALRFAKNNRLNQAQTFNVLAAQVALPTI